MNPYYLKVEIQDGELEQVMDDLEKARKMIEDCGNKLRALGVVTVEKEEAVSGN